MPLYYNYTIIFTSWSEFVVHFLFLMLKGYKMNSLRRKRIRSTWYLKRRYSFRRDSNHRSMDNEANSLPLSYLICWWMGTKVAYIRSRIVCLQINQVYAIVTNVTMTNCEQCRTKCCAKIAATLTLASTDVFLIKMWQKSYNRRESWVS